MWFDLFGVFVALAREEANRRGSRTSILNQWNHILNPETRFLRHGSTVFAWSVWWVQTEREVLPSDSIQFKSLPQPHWSKDSALFEYLWVDLSPSWALSGVWFQMVDIWWNLKFIHIVSVFLCEEEGVNLSDSGAKINSNPDKNTGATKSREP